MFEGTGKYFLMIFIIYLIVFLTVKICLGKIFKSMGIDSWKAHIPFYNRKVLISNLDLKKEIFYKTLIPFLNLYYYKIIIESLLKAYKLDSNEAIYFILFPMYKFPELIYKNPKFTLHMYDDTEEFFDDQNVLYKTEKVDDKLNDLANNEYFNPQNTVQNPFMNLLNEQHTGEINNQNLSDFGTQNTVQNPFINVTNNQSFQSNVQVPLANAVNSQNLSFQKDKLDNDTVFTNQNLQPDERKETFINAQKEKAKKEIAPIFVDDGKPKICPKCGTKLASTASTCFLCGTKLD